MISFILKYFPSAEKIQFLLSIIMSNKLRINFLSVNFVARCEGKHLKNLKKTESAYLTVIRPAMLSINQPNVFFLYGYPNLFLQFP